MRALVRAVCWLLFVPPFVVFGCLAAACFGAAILTRAVPPS